MQTHLFATPPLPKLVESRARRESGQAQNGKICRQKRAPGGLSILKDQGRGDKEDLFYYPRELVVTRVSHNGLDGQTVQPKESFVPLILYL